MLSLRIELLTGRYIASEFNDRNRAEWPPHPARVFSALVAAHNEGQPTEDQRAALLWLEEQPAPRLCFSDASRRAVRTHYVPVNDKALSDAATVQSAWDAVRSPHLAEKKRDKAEARLHKAYGKAMVPAPKLGKEFRSQVAHVLPSSRTRQPRTFPSVTPSEPVVWLSWDADPGPQIRAGLDALARAVARLGHSSSMVAVRWTDDAPSPRWVPDLEGIHVIRWVGPGQLDALTALHAAAPDSEQRVMPYVVARYRPASALPAIAQSCFDSRFIVLRKVEGPRVPIAATETVADAVRGALLRHAEDPPPGLLSGHEPSGRPLQVDHLAIVPLPFVGNRRASGDLLGVALVPPAGLDLDSLHPLHVAIARWEAAHANPGDTARSTLTLGRLGAWTLERMVDVAPLYNLRESTWCGPSTTWCSVTPVVLDRHPGSLHDGHASRRARATARARATLTAACERIGLPAPVEIELSPAPLMAGSVPARRFVRRPQTKDPRPLVHVRLVFGEPVEGPVLLGAGRYRGLGLFRPMGGPHA